MPGPESRNPSDPLEAETWITPEGFDVSTVEGARTYLWEVHGIEPLEAAGPTDRGTAYHYALALQKEKRHAIYDESGENRQNVAEHTANLAITTVRKAAEERPDLDIGKISIMATFHDIIEAPFKDVGINDEEGLKHKKWGEKAAMTLIRHDWKDAPYLLGILEEYEEGQTPEARYVKAMDKVEAYQFALNTKAALQKSRWENYTHMVQEALPKAVIDHTAFGLMQDVLVNLGRKWHEWGCMPFDGNPEEIVRRVAQEVQREYEVKQIVLDGINAVVCGFTGESKAPQDLKQPVIDSHTAQKMGVTLLSDHRQNNKTPPTNTPPASPAVALPA